MAKQVEVGTPLSVLDQRVFLDGVLVDADTITYSLTKSAVPVTDEDGIAVTGRTPLQVGTGHYSAGNTVLDSTSLPGTDYVIEWSIKKTAAAAVITRSESFELLSSEAEDPTRDGVSRRDIADTTNLKELRGRIKDNKSDDTKWAFFNSELQSFLDRAIAQHTGSERTELDATEDDLAMAMQLAHAYALHSLATDKVRFFKWRDGNESVDKSMLPQNCIRLANSILDQYNAEMDRRLEKAKVAGFAEKREGRLMRFNARNRGRGGAGGFR